MFNENAKKNKREEWACGGNPWAEHDVKGVASPASVAFVNSTADIHQSTE